MKLRKILLRWYKSFHLNYRGITEKKEAAAYRPWNKMSPPYAPTDESLFIEIPVEADITTIVGANESGKSDLVNAISKVVRDVGIEGDKFERTDLCHFAGVRTRNIEAWPNIRLQFTYESEKEFTSINEAVGGAVTTKHARMPIPPPRAGFCVWDASAVLPCVPEAPPFDCRLWRHQRVESTGSYPSAGLPSGCWKATSKRCARSWPRCRRRRLYPLADAANVWITRPSSGWCIAMPAERAWTLLSLRTPGLAGCETIDGSDESGGGKRHKCRILTTDSTSRLLLLDL
jgi:hypothetical protein